MKKILCLAAGLLAFSLAPVFAQPAPPPAPSTFAERLQKIIEKQNSSGSQSPVLTKFNLDFPGGTPKQLVAAIEKAMGKPLNVIIAEEKNAKVTLPPMKVNDMDVAKIFKALEENQYSGGDIVKRIAFYTDDSTPSDNTLWKFVYYEKPAMLTAFSLDFKGGPPSLLVEEIEKAMGKPLNVVIRPEDNQEDLPPLKMDNVYLPQLFTALEAASHKVINIPYSGTGGRMGVSQFSSSYGFKTADTVTDTAVWYFHVEKPSLPPVVAPQKICQFYSLANYLDRGFTVDDITTAIRTGWKMAGETAAPELNYHKETRMLMVYGEPDKLKTIVDVLNTLPQTRYDLPTVEAQLKSLKKEVDLLDKRRSEADLLLNKLSNPPPLPSGAVEINPGK